MSQKGNFMVGKGESKAGINGAIVPMSGQKKEWVPLVWTGGGQSPDTAECESHLAEAEMRSQNSMDGRF